ncbi:MAG: DEAD/DEAH box helicase [Halobacteriaceae archaeon]
MTDIEALPVPAVVRDHYHERGITELYPPQRVAVEAGLFEGADIVAAVPTASGKTLIAELAMVAADGVSLYVVPLRALAHEKAETFAALPDTEVVVATGDVTEDVGSIGDADIVVATSEKANAVLRTGPDWVSALSCVVVDEFHLLDDETRGPTVEMTVAILRDRHPDLQLVGLSATVGNATQLAEWLDADLVETDWRPVELRRGIAVEDQITYADGTVAALDTSTDSVTGSLVTDTLTEEGQCLVFVHSRRAAEDLAAELASLSVTAGGSVAATLRQSARTGMGRRLADAAAGGAAFHHAGLRDEHRARVEAAFRDGDLAVLCATPTLAAGVNLPARRVIVRDHERYTDDGWTALPVLDVHQMMGRAGRPGLDPYGEAILVADDAETARTLETRYLHATPEPVRSALATQDALRTHVLGAVAGGFAETRDRLLSVLSGTFYAFEAEHTTLVDVADLVLDDLAGDGFIERDDGLAVTALGRTVAEQFIDPHTGAAFREALSAFPALAAVTRRSVLEVACNATDVEGFYLQRDEQGGMHRYARRHAGEFVTDPTALEEDYVDWLATVKTVRVLAAYLDGESEAVLTERYGIGPGDLRVTGEQVTWMVGALAAIADLEDSPAVEQVRAVRDGLEDRVTT